ncbi:MAG: histidine kinase dimerization/phospho-acceptor domain-containing protein [Candidatus Binatia bacterium]
MSLPDSAPISAVFETARNNPWLVRITYLVIAGVFAVDLLLPPGFAPGVLYVAPVLVMLFLPPRHRPFLIGILCTPLLILGFWWSPLGGPVWPVWIDMTNRALVLGVIWATAIFSERHQELQNALRRSHENLELRVQERTAELTTANAALQTTKRELARERDLLRVTLQSIGDAVITTDTTAVLTFMNPAAEEVTGWSSYEAMGKSITEILPLYDEYTHSRRDNPITRVLQQGIVVELGNHTFLTARDGHEVPIADSAAPIRDLDGHTYGAVMIFRDVTAQQQAKAALQRAKDAAEAADRAKSEFLASMSHELRTPLNVVLGYADLLVDGEFGPLTPAQTDAILRIRRRAHELFELISALLDLSRLEAGRLPLRISTMTTVDFLETVKAETQEICDRPGLQVRWSLENDLPTIATDIGKLKVVLKNLVGNAVKFTPTGSITVEARSAGV